MNDLYLFLVPNNQNAQFIQQYQRQRYDGKGEWITCWGDHCCQYNDSDNGMSLIFDQHTLPYELFQRKSEQFICYACRYC